MKVRHLALCILGVLVGCSGSRQAGEPASPGRNPALLKQEGQRQLAMGNPDSAVTLLQEALALDSTSVGTREDLALARYQRAFKGDSIVRPELGKEAFAAYEDLEMRGEREMAVYDRLCELAQRMNDTSGFLLYATRAAEHFPHDRQMFNLGSAQFAAGRYRETASSQKEALERFPDSPYRSGFYRLLGQAYVRVDRYQSAQRVLAEGVEEAERVLSSTPGQQPNALTRSRIEEDRIAMLLSLRRLYSIYQEEEKLNEVERRLKSAGRLQ